jgi:hypothetical protein
MQSPSTKIIQSVGDANMGHTSNESMALAYALLAVIGANVSIGDYTLSPVEAIVNVLTSAGVGAGSKAIHYLRRHFGEVQ